MSSKPERYKNPVRPKGWKRIPLDKQNVLIGSADPGYRGTWQNDDGDGNIQRHLDAGWVFKEGNVRDTHDGQDDLEQSNEGTLMKRRVNWGSDASCTHAYFMQIPEKEALEDDSRYFNRVYEQETSFDPKHVIRKANEQNKSLNYLYIDNQTRQQK